MEMFSLLSGVDNLRKLIVVLGLIFISLGIIFPLQKNLELKDKEIKLEESYKIDSAEIRNLETEVEKCSVFIKSNGTMLKMLGHQRDSMIKQKLDGAGTFKLNLILAELSALQTKDEASVKSLKDNYFEIEKAKIRTESLQKEINNLKSFISKYTLAQILFIVVGVVFLLIGMWNWNKSQKESDKLKGIEINIKEEELKKIQKENTSS